MSAQAPLSEHGQAVARAIQYCDRDREELRERQWRSMPDDLRFALLREMRYYEPPFRPATPPPWSAFGPVEKRRIVTAACRIRRNAELLDGFR